MLFCKGGLVSLPIPHKPLLETTTINGQFAYYLSVGKSYRDLLLKMGIDYNAEMNYVKQNEWWRWNGLNIRPVW